MNVITFNDHIDEMHKKAKKHLAAQIANREIAMDGLLDGMFPNWRTAPLFNYESTHAREAAAFRDMTLDTDPFESWPFNVYRMNVTSYDEKRPEDGKYRAKAVVAHWGAAGTIVLARVDTLIKDKPDLGATRLKPNMLPLFLFMNRLQFNRAKTMELGKHAAMYDWVFGCGGNWVSEAPAYLANTYCDGFLKTLATFLYDCMLPTMHIATVHPADEEHRSVEWVKARTHYTLIMHGHPANRKGVAEGERVPTEKNGELSRMAGNRREHWRTYRHPRYRFMKGKRQLIKATWVGPKEWKDEGGKQIYKILEPVES